MSSTIGITRVRAALFINYILYTYILQKITITYSVLRLVIHQRFCIFPAETLLMLMMLDQDLSFKLYFLEAWKYFFISGHF